MKCVCFFVFFFGEVQLFSLSSFFPPFKIIFLVLADQWWPYICNCRRQPKFLKLGDFKIVGHCCKVSRLFVCEGHSTVASPITRGPRTSILEKHLNVVLVLREKPPCWLACANPWCFAWMLGDCLCAVWSPGTKRGRAGQDREQPWSHCRTRGQTGGRSLAPIRAGVGRRDVDKRMWIFPYAQTLPNLLAFVMNVCLKVVSDVSVPLLLFVFRFNPHFPLSTQHPEYFQTSIRKCGCYVLCNVSSSFSRRKTV